MITYPVWRKLFSWRECFMKRSISARIHTADQRVILGLISALFLCKIASVSFFFISSSFQVQRAICPDRLSRTQPPPIYPRRFPT